MPYKNVYDDCLKKLRLLSYSGKILSLFLEYEHIDIDFFKLIRDNPQSNYKKMMLSYCYWNSISLLSHEIDEILHIITPFIDILK